MCKSNKKPKIICISGKAGHGKDTCAIFAKDLLESCNRKVQIIHYADLLKYICTTFFGWNGIKDDAGRHLLQEVGIKSIKSKNPTFLIDFVANLLDFFSDHWDFVIIPDARFPEEIDTWREQGYNVEHWHVFRPSVSTLTPDQQKDVTETSLDRFPCDVSIENTGTLEELKTLVERSIMGKLFREEVLGITNTSLNKS